MELSAIGAKQTELEFANSNRIFFNPTTSKHVTKWTRRHVGASKSRTVPTHAPMYQGRKISS